MLQSIKVVFAALALMGLMASSVSAETPEELVKRMNKKSESYKSMYIEMEIKADSPYMQMSGMTKSWYMSTGEDKFKCDPNLKRR